MRERLAAIVLFVYARPEHTLKTLAALVANPLARSSNLIVYSDGAKGPHDEIAVALVRNVVRTTTGFASVSLVERQTNMGLAANILDGLSQVFERHAKAIVLEDDIVCAPSFLTFMNEALVQFEVDRRIWHINGWNYPIKNKNLPDVYCSRTMNCWGWATWRDRWLELNTDAEYFMKKWSVVNKFRFNQDGTYPFYSHLISNYLGERRTWAIYWYATIFDAKGLCLTPGVTLTNEMGSDGSGTHGLNNEMYVANLSMSENWNFQGLDATEDQVARVAVASFNRQYYGILSRMINTLRLVIPLWWRHMQRKGG